MSEYELSPEELTPEQRASVLDDTHRVKSFMVAPVVEWSTDEDGLPDSLERMVVIHLADIADNEVNVAMPISVFEVFALHINAVAQAHKELNGER